MNQSDLIGNWIATILTVTIGVGFAFGAKLLMRFMYPGLPPYFYLAFSGLLVAVWTWRTLEAHDG